MSLETTRSVRTRLVQRISRPPDREHLVTSGVGPEGELLLVWADSPGLRILQPDDEGFDSGRDLPEVPVTITRHRPDRPLTSVETRVRGWGLQVQPLPGGRIITMSWGIFAGLRPGARPVNATVHGRDGSIEEECFLGEAASDVRSTSSGHVWVGFGDTGIFGGTGRGPDGLSQAVGAGSGLVRFDARWRPTWTFAGFPPVEAGSRGGAIDDCERLWVSGDDVMAFAWGGPWRGSGIESFGFVAEDESWTTGAAAIYGIKAFVTDGRRVVTAGRRWEHEPDALSGITLQDGWSDHALGRLVLPDGSGLPVGARIHGTGTDFHVVVDEGWFGASLADVWP